MQSDLRNFLRFQETGFLEKRLVFEGGTAPQGSGEAQTPPAEKVREGTTNEELYSDLDIKKTLYTQKFQALDESVTRFKGSPNATIQLAAKQAETKMQSMKPEKIRALDEKGVKMWLAEIDKVMTYFEAYPAYDAKKRHFETKSSEWVKTMTASLHDAMEQQLDDVKAKYPGLKADALFSLQQIMNGIGSQVTAKVDLAKSVIFEQNKGLELTFQDYLGNPGKLGLYTDENLNTMLDQGISMFDKGNDAEFQKGYLSLMERFEAEMEAVVIQYEANTPEKSKNYVRTNAEKVWNYIMVMDSTTPEAMARRQTLLDRVSRAEALTVSALELVQGNGEEQSKTRAVVLGNFMDQMLAIQDQVAAGNSSKPRESFVRERVAKRVGYKGDPVMKGFEEGAQVSGGILDSYSDPDVERILGTVAEGQSGAQERVEDYVRNPQKYKDNPEAEELYRQIGLAKVKGENLAKHQKQLGEKATPEEIRLQQDTEVQKVVEAYIKKLQGQVVGDVEGRALTEKRTKVNNYYETTEAGIVGGVKNVQFRGEGGVRLGFLQPGEKFHVTGAHVYEVAAGKGKVEAYYHVRLANGAEGYVPVKFVKMDREQTKTVRVEDLPQVSSEPEKRVDIKDLPNA